MDSGPSARMQLDQDCNPCHCLVTSIGSISADAVISSLKTNQISKVVGCDIHSYAWIPVSSRVDSFYQVPHAHENQHYLDRLIEIIIKENIRYVIPLTDPEVDYLAKNRTAIEKQGAKLCVSGGKSIRICRDKLAFYEYLKNDSNVTLIPTFRPSEFSPHQCEFPMIAKPREGRSSIGVFVIERPEALNFNLFKMQNYILQPFLTGEIFTVDLVRNQNTRKCFAVTRKEMIRTCNGAGLSVEVSHNKGLAELTQYIGEILNIHGCINMEFIFKDNKYYLMDINPRFSAGVSFSILAGYDMVVNHLRCFTGDEIQDPIQYETMFVARKFTDVIIPVAGGNGHHSAA